MACLAKKLRQPHPLGALTILVAAVFLFYWPILPTYFLADDYNYVGHLLSNAGTYVQGENLGRWFVDFSAQGMQDPSLSIFFRPVVQWLWLTDYVAWGNWATGYHLTNVILHALNSFWVYLVAWGVLRHRGGALIAGLLFALHPIHADSVSWIADRTDVLSTFFYLGSAAFFVLFRLRSTRLYSTLSVVAFALAIGTKENTVALPLVLFAYDLLFSFSARRFKIFWTLIPYGVVLLGYVGMRFFFFHEFGRNTGGGFLSYGAGLFLQFYTQALFQPFIPDMNFVLLSLVLGLVAAGLILYRSRPGLWFGAGWIVFSLLPSASAAYVAPRLVYAPSAGLAIALAAILIRPFPRQGDKVALGKRAWRPGRFSVFNVPWPTTPFLVRYSSLRAHSLLANSIGAALAGGLVLAYAWGLQARVSDWVAAGTVAGVIPAETQRLYPSLPPGTSLYYTGVPDIFRGIFVYNDNFGSALQIGYKETGLQAWRVDHFPLLTSRLDQVRFFEYRRRTITERRDVLQMLERRLLCLEQAQPGVTWDFSRGTQGWEAWNDLAPFESGASGLTTRAIGIDPNMGGPPMDIPAISLAVVEVQMRVRSAAPKTQGALFWMTAGQTDFSPGQKQEFPVQADGEWHTYRIDLVGHGRMNLDDHIVRLRLDPADAPSEIGLGRIQINTVCAQNEGCTCP